MIENIKLDGGAELKERMDAAELYDFYGGLLSESNQELFEMYVINDLSLGEVADNIGISRQGVSDAVGRCKKQLNKYEAQLGLARKSKQLQEYAQKIKSCADRLLCENAGENERKEADKLKNIADCINTLL